MATLKWFINEGNYYYFKDAPAHTTGVSLNKNSIQLTTAGQTEQLTATIIPAGALEQGVTWSSSDDSVATVSNTGLVTCITPGECTITVTTVYGGYTANCSVSELPYTPTANTLVYFPFISNANDYSGNNYTLDASGIQETIGRRFNSNINVVGSMSTLANFQSYWLRVYNPGSDTQSANVQSQIYGYPPAGYMAYQGFRGYGYGDGDMVRFVYGSSWGQYSKTVGAKDNPNNWYHIVMAYANPGGAWCFINGTKYVLTSNTNNYSPTLPISSFPLVEQNTSTLMDIAISDYIAETVARSDADVLAYFNANKSKYGIS